MDDYTATPTPTLIGHLAFGAGGPGTDRELVAELRRRAESGDERAAEWVRRRDDPD